MKELLNREEYIFYPQQKKIKFKNKIRLENIIIIINLNNGKIMYDGDNYKGVINSSNELILDNDEVLQMSNTDILQIYVFNNNFLNFDCSLNIKRFNKIPNGYKEKILVDSRSLKGGDEVSIRFILDKFFCLSNLNFSFDNKEDIYLCKFYYSEDGNNESKVFFYEYINNYIYKDFDFIIDGDNIKSLYLYIKKITSGRGNILVNIRGIEE